MPDSMQSVLPSSLPEYPNSKWLTCSVLVWGIRCAQSCLKGIRNLCASRQCPKTIGTWRRFFSKQGAQKFPPHRPFNCAINMLPGSTTPRGKLYSLSSPEQLAMEEYIQEALSLGLFHPSTSAAGVFFHKRRRMEASAPA